MKTKNIFRKILYFPVTSCLLVFDLLPMLVGGSEFHNYVVRKLDKNSLTVIILYYCIEALILLL
jgi:hypothetical protein